MNNERIKIIIVEPSHPGNIGATARAMKTMDLSQLVLVNPKSFPNVNATARAAGADDLLANAKIFSSFEEAIKDSKLVIGTSNRIREIPLPVISPREVATKILAEATKHEVSIVFGRENNGLSNEELIQCHYQIMIPTNPDFNSLNLASAVQIIAYEIKLARENRSFSAEFDEPLASSEEMKLFYQHLEKVLIEIDFLNPKYPRKLMARLVRLFNRSRLLKTELNILRGILTAIETKNEKANLS
jgi:tRNA (cytidine32/uridine32-2'-O)-methyltransferase